MPTEAVASPSPALLPTAESIATPTSFTDLLEARGAVSTVYMVSGNDVWSISSDGKATRLFSVPDGSAIRAIHPSPDAKEVAVLLDVASGQEQVFQVVLVDDAGSVVARIDATGKASATPVTRAAHGRQSIDWSPQGDRVLAQLQPADIVEFAADGDSAPVPLDFGGASGSVIEPAWSPTGQNIAFIAESDDGETRSLQMLDTVTGKISTLVTPLRDRLVVDFAWLPDGVSLLFTEGGVPGSAITGIDLWRVDANGENRALVASAGTVAPVARIANISPSPDGRSVAYSVLVPGSAGPVVDSIWVRSLSSGVGFRIPLPSIASVDEIWWTNEGLVVSVVTRGTVEGRPPTEALLQVRAGRINGRAMGRTRGCEKPTRATPIAGPAST